MAGHEDFIKVAAMNSQSFEPTLTKRFIAVSRNLITLSMSFFCLTVCHAQGAKIEIAHQPTDAKALPAAATWMPISVELKHTRDIDLEVRLVGSRDGRFLDITMPRGSLNEADNAVYKVDVPAPIAAMSYQFVIRENSGGFTVSPRYVAQRACVQNFKVDVDGKSSDAAFRRHVSELVSKAKLLERSTANYEAALKIIEELKSKIPG